MLRQLAVSVVNLQTMHNPPDILSLAYRQSVLQDQFVMIQKHNIFQVLFSILLIGIIILVTGT